MTSRKGIRKPSIEAQIEGVSLEDALETSTDPTISVCMATYNGEKYLYEQLQSILTQLGDHDELVISDDHSTDRTVDIIKSCNDDRIRLIYNDAARGYTRNFENAIRHAAGNIIFIADQDDVWRADKIQVMRRYLQDYDLVISDATYVNHALEVTLGSHFKLIDIKAGFIRQLLRPRYIGACMAFNRVLLQKLLPFPRRSKFCAYDYWITLIGESCYKSRLIDDQLILYRRHEGNASPAGASSPNSLLTKVLIRAYSLSNLAMRIAQ
jgi:glycosyltransferase involved in cell wall biosynthesis